MNKNISCGRIYSPVEHAFAAVGYITVVAALLGGIWLFIVWRRSSFRLSLRMVLTSVAVLCCGLAVVEWRLRAHRRFLHAKVQLEERGADVMVFWRETDWLLMIPDSERIGEVRVSSSEFDSADMEYLDDLPQVGILSLTDCPVATSDVANRRWFGHLQSLCVRRTNVNDDLIERLPRTLKHLDVRGTNIGPAALRSLADHRQLEILCLSTAQLNNDVRKVVSSLPNLWYLAIDGRVQSQAQMTLLYRMVSKCKTLTDLNARDLVIDDRQRRQLRKCVRGRADHYDAPP